MIVNEKNEQSNLRTEKKMVYGDVPLLRCSMPKKTRLVECLLRKEALGIITRPGRFGVSTISFS